MGDECYSHFTYEPHKPYSIASAARGSKETSSSSLGFDKRSR